jgi:hypothetical protein
MGDKKEIKYVNRAGIYRDGVELPE